MECLICFNYIKKSCVGSCNHHYCSECLIKWCKFNNVCPKCKCIIREIKPDPEFDQLSFLLFNSLSKKEDLELNDIFFFLKNKNTREIIIKFTSNSIAGITLQNNSGPGVKVTKIEVGGQAKMYGLVVSNIILSLNNVPCNNHKQAIDIIDDSMFSNKDLKCVIIA